MLSKEDKKIQDFAMAALFMGDQHISLSRLFNGFTTVWYATKVAAQQSSI